MEIPWGYHGYTMGIPWVYHGDEKVLEQSEVLPLRVVPKLWHWPSTALFYIYFISRSLIGQSGQILAYYWITVAINITDGHKMLS
jgi:hypothetical protein